MDLNQAIEQWESGEPVKTVDMGGMGHSYEQAIQECVFPLSKSLINNKLPDDNEEFNKALNKILYPICDKLTYGLSGAQAGAIKSLAYAFVKQGYEEVLKSVEPERIITMRHNPNFWKM